MFVAQDCLKQVEGDRTLLDCMIRGIESWIFRYDSDMKRQSKQYLSPGGLKPKKNNYF